MPSEACLHLTRRGTLLQRKDEVDCVQVAASLHFPSLSRNLDVLPTEILVEILHLLDAPQRASCRLVCKKFDYIVCHNARLRYPIELALADCVDGHPEHPARAGIRHRLLLTRQDAWRKQDFHKKRQILSSDCPCIPTASAYRNGILVFGALNFATLSPHIDNPEVINLLRSTYINELYVFFLWTTGPPGEHSHRRFPIPYASFSDFELEPSQDLLVLWDSYAPNADGLRLRLLSLREGIVHKRAKFHEMIVSTEILFPDGATPEDIRVFHFNSVQLRGEFVIIYARQGRQILLYDWVTSYHWVLPGSSCCMLSDDCLIIANCHCNPPHFDVYQVDHSTQPAKIHHVHRYLLPRVKAGSMASIDCRPSASSSRQSVTPESCAVPFFTAPDCAMVVFSFCLRSPNMTEDDPDKQFALLCYTSRILSEVRRHVPRASAEGETPLGTDWESWGPDSSFFFGDTTNNDNVWLYALYGYRLMFDTTLYDFNPHTIAAAEAGEDGMEIRKGTSFSDPEQWFAQTVQTNRPYACAPIQMSKVPEFASCFLVDEDVLALGDGTDANLDPVIVTQMTVGPEWDGYP